MNSIHGSPAQQRDRTLAALTQAPLDLLIIGGGIVGAGVARDAAMRGLRVGLVEQRDFAFGTSSRSTRLLHGGLRYLAQGRIGLVREASLEKKTLHRIAPHLAEPLGFVFPTYRGSGWPLWQMRIGVKIYDLLCSGRNLGSSFAMSKGRVTSVIPKLKADGLTGAVRYFDGLTNDARLVLDTLRSAAHHGGMVLNYCRFLDAAPEAGGWICQLEEQLGSAGSPGFSLSGSTRSTADRLNSGLQIGGWGGRAFKVQARAIVNATGPWADGLPHSRVKLRVSKGIHLVVPRSRLPVPDAVVITEGKRLLFVIPWGERLIVGTTDTDYHGALDDVRANRQDVDYVLRSVNEFFPQAAISAADVIRTWAGLRPLIANPNGTPSDISRAHEIRNPEPGWWDVAGGKLTTYRLMAEQTVDRIIPWLHKSAGLNGKSGEWKLCRTADEVLLPAAEVEGFSGVLPPEFGWRAVEHFCAKEWGYCLEDVMVRRSSWHYYHADAGQKAERVADWMAEFLGWSAAEKAAELDHYRTSLGWREAEGMEAAKR